MDWLSSSEASNIFATRSSLKLLVEFSCACWNFNPAFWILGLIYTANVLPLITWCSTKSISPVTWNYGEIAFWYVLNLSIDYGSKRNSIFNRTFLLSPATLQKARYIVQRAFFFLQYARFNPYFTVSRTRDLLSNFWRYSLSRCRLQHFRSSSMYRLLLFLLFSKFSRWNNFPFSPISF